MSGAPRLAINASCALAFGIGAALVAVAASAADEKAQALTAAYNASGQQLFKLFAAKPGNIVFSPYSIGTAMAMALSGARGQNEAEMIKVLKHRLPREQIDAANSEVLAVFDGYGKAADAPAQLRIANALMITKTGGVITPEFEALLREKYAAEVFRGADLAKVNAWVKEKTDGKIDSLLDRLSPQTAAVLLDAIYFKAPWQKTFDAQATHPETFHLVSGEAEVPMMHQRSEFALAARQGYKAIRLPYAGDHLAMVVALPDEGVSLADAIKRLDGEEATKMLAALHAPVKTVDLALPRFTANFKAGLVEAFTQLGMHKAFDTHSANFSGMTGRPQTEVPLAIDQIMHRAVIEVTEEGTEAAAATGVAIGVRSMRPAEIENFHVDRPFLFYIVDDTTGAVLFQGRIVDPRQAS